MTDKGKHFHIILTKTDTGLVLVATTTFVHTTSIKCAVHHKSVLYWIPVHPVTKNNTYDMIAWATDGDSKPIWVNVQKSHTIKGKQASGLI